MTDRRLRTPADLEGLAFDSRGLVPVIAQDVATGRVLMLAWASREALERSLSSGEMHYWSRSRHELWRKGATSGNTQELRSLHADCDGDTVLALVRPTGPACHTGERTCFGEESATGLQRLWEILVSRRDVDPDTSYTARLLSDENLRVKKLGEEAAELVHALAARPADAGAEAADLFYHVLTALLGAGATLEEVLEELDARRNRPPRNG